MLLEYMELSVAELIDYVQAKRILAKPDFQRDYDWTVEQVEDILRTAVRDWPAGSLLLLRTSPELPFRAVTALKGAPELDEHAKPTFLVLDGQQRLTSLYQALTRNSTHVFYVDMNMVDEQDGFEDDALSSVKLSEYPTEREAAKQLWLAVDTMYDQVKFQTWLDQVAPARKDRLSELFDQHLSAIRLYKFPANILPAAVEMRSLVSIFTNLNRLGKPLTTFDLLVAMLSVEDFDLREAANQAEQEFGIIGRNPVTVDPVELLKLMTLHEYLRPLRGGEVRKVKGIREKDVLDYVDSCAGTIPGAWTVTVDEYANALKFLNEKCGAVTRNLMPQTAMILALSVGLSQSDARPGFTRDLERWVWTTYFSQAYRQGSNTRALADSKELIAWSQDPNALPTSLETLTTQPELVRERLRDSRKGNTAFEKGLMALLVARGAPDWFSPNKGELQGLLTHEGAIDFHHCFPDAFLTERGKPSEMMINFTPLKASTNRAIGKDAPSTQMTLTRFDDGALQLHLIDATAFRDEDLEAFTQKRIEAFASLIAVSCEIPAIGVQP
jgi:hypothetical protein